MSNHGENAKLIVSVIDKGAVDETSLIPNKLYALLEKFITYLDMELKKNTAFI